MTPAVPHVITPESTAKANEKWAEVAQLDADIDRLNAEIA